MQDWVEQGSVSSTGFSTRRSVFFFTPGPTVRLLMPYEVRALGEGLSTSVTRVGALPGVGPLMPDEVGALAEGLCADLALIGLGSGVSPQVLGDG